MEALLHLALLFDLLLRRWAAAASPEKEETPPARQLQLPPGAPLISSLQIEFSSGGGASISWDYYVPRYSLTVPSEAVAVAVVAQIDMGGVQLTLYRPEDDYREVLVSGKPSAFVDVPTEEATVLVLELQQGVQRASYVVSVMRSTITARFQLSYVDVPRDLLPQGTLTGLGVFNSFGTPLRTTPPAFMPRQPQYLAAMDMTSPFTWLVASSNDPDATLAVRVNGDRWLPLEVGRNSQTFTVPERGWLLLEVRVESPTAAAAGHAPFVYEVLVTRDPICHERCSRCTGPGEGDCVSCRPPLVLSAGFCGMSACPVDGYFDWRTAECQACHASCAQCNGPGADACTLCPALRFLSPPAWTDRAGPCVSECPSGKYAHPRSRRCRSPPTAPIRAFYVSLLFRLRFTNTHHDARLLESIQNTTAFVLGVSLSDVQMYRVEARGEMLSTLLEVVSPFVSRGDADRVPIDSWFGALEIPVDGVSSLSWEEVHPAPPPEPIRPFLELWTWGLIFSAAVALAITIVTYCCYFRRLKNIKKKYKTRHGIDFKFIDRVVNQSPAYLVSRFIQFESGAKHFNHKAIKNG